MRVRMALAARQRSGSWLARQIGMPRASLTRRLRGDGEFSLDELGRVAVVLGVDVTDFIKDDASTSVAS